MKAWSVGCLACLLSVPASAHSSPTHRNVEQAFRHEYRVGDRNFASRPVGLLARADVPLTGHAGPMFGPADRPTGSHVLSARETVP